MLTGQSGSSHPTVLLLSLSISPFFGKGYSYIAYLMGAHDSLG